MRALRSPIGSCSTSDSLASGRAEEERDWKLRRYIDPLEHTSLYQPNTKEAAILNVEQEAKTIVRMPISQLKRTNARPAHRAAHTQ